MGSFCGGCDSLVWQPASVSSSVPANCPLPPIEPLNGGIIKKRNWQIIAPIASDQDGEFADQPTERELLEFSLQLQTVVVSFEKENGMLTNRFTKATLATDRLLKDFMKQTANLEPPSVAFSLAKQQFSSSQPGKSHLHQIRALSSQQSCLSPSKGISESDDSAVSISFQQPSRLLNDSIFTSRKLIIGQFYGQHSEVDGIKLHDWDQKQCRSLEISWAECLSLSQKNLSAEFIMALAAISNHKHKQGENLVLCTDLGVRVHLNGQKRLFLTEIPLKCLAQFEQIASISATMKIPNILHCLTGWIPECISMSELTTVDEIFERLAANLDDGNIIATVTNSSTYQHLLLTGVNVLEKTLKTNSVNMATVLDTVGSKVEGEPGAYSVTWNDLVELYEEININWNPGIYECCHRCHGTVTRLNSSLYVLRIPPCEEDIEVRLFVETHFSISSQLSNLLIELYQYDGVCQPELNSKDCIRSISNNSCAYSDIILFETCPQKNYYLLRFTTASDDSYKEASFTASVYSFMQVEVSKFKQKKIIKQIDYCSYLHVGCLGKGLNSPNYDKNLQFAITGQLGSLLRIIVEAPDSHQYELSLLADPQETRNLTRLSIESLMNDITTSSHKTGKGNLNVLLLHKSYILVINSFTATKSELKIRLQLYSNADIVNPCLSIHELCHNPKSVFSQSIKWFPTNSGPRKRLKSNTTPHFQPYHYFLEFFNNPYLDKDLLSGTYQFHVCSDTFRECFENSSDRDTINCEPPALSMAIFEISPDSKSFRIVLDDAYYVPFGIGFWSQPLTLEQARYRFVLPKMEKDFSKGTFSIMNV